ncbi:hypothetical protein Hdeb2414_s0003g00093071 [Helianthus debilis subsp. tardiflorus]
MAKNKDDIKHATAQAKLSEDESLRVAYVANTPLEAGKIADSEPVDLFAAAHNISNQQQQDKRVIAESKPLDLFSAAKGVSDANKMDEGTANRQPSAK